MKFLTIPVAILCLVGGAFFLFAGGKSDGGRESRELSVNKEGNDSTVEGVAVVELFTSEVCSSCPPAEKLLNSLAATAEENNLRLYPVAFHVDYWNRLGWKDRFSSPRWSERQNQYAAAFRAETIYTPQMVVNGSAEFVGSNESQAKREIERAMKERPAVGITAEAALDTSGVVHYTCRLDALPSGTDLVLLLVEKNLSSDVSRGENRGKQLDHENVVRLLEQVPLHDKREVEGSLIVPEEVNREQIDLICFVQEQKSMKIIGATKVEL